MTIVCCYTHPSLEKDHVEGYTRDQYQPDFQINCLQESETDAREHVDGNIGVGHVFEGKNEVEPGEEHCRDSYLPLHISRATSNHCQSHG